jgi:hypothetical protein
MTRQERKGGVPVRHGRRTTAVGVGLALLLAAPAHALFEDLEMSPRARSLGGAYAGLSSDASGIFYNPAGLVGIEGRDLRGSWFRPFDLGFHRANAVAFAMPWRDWGTFGVGYSDYRAEWEDEVLAVERAFTLSHALVLMEDLSSSLAFGYNLNLYNLDYPALSVSGLDLGSQTTLGVDVGFLATLRERTTAGVFAKNLNNPTVGDPVEDDLPQRVSGGIAYRPYEGVVTAVEMEKQLGEDVQLHGGVEFRVVEPLSLRFGAQTKPNLFDVGVGLEWQRVQVDLAYTHHPVLDHTIRYGLGLKL